MSLLSVISEDSEGERREGKEEQEEAVMDGTAPSVAVVEVEVHHAPSAPDAVVVLGEEERGERKKILPSPLAMEEMGSGLGAGGGSVA